VQSKALLWNSPELEAEFSEERRSCRGLNEVSRCLFGRIGLFALRIFGLKSGESQADEAELWPFGLGNIFQFVAVIEDQPKVAVFLSRTRVLFRLLVTATKLGRN